MTATKIGVRELVELTVRTGDLNPVTSASNNTAMLGSRIHRKLQRDREPNFEKEVYLEQTVTINGQDYLINGRADGIITQEQPVIEEIKTSARTFDELDQNTKDRYWAQVFTYGHFLCERDKLKSVELDLIYYQTSTDEITRLTQVKTAQELAERFDDLINEFTDWLTMRSDIVTARNQSVRKLDFPFPAYRQGQRELAVAVYKTIYAKTRLFVEAPTGTGKTISTLFPAIKSMGEELVNRLFYLTAKQSTRHVAEGAMVLLADHGLVAKSITLTAKEAITFADEPDDPSLNPYMIGYYDRLKPALKDLFANENQLTRDVIETYAKKHTLDPFEFSLDASLFCDVIICDYNYLFDPTVYLQRFFSEPDPGNFFLIDEAHNLVSRARSMYSADINDQAFVELKKQLRGKYPSLRAVKKGINQVITTFDTLQITLEEANTSEMFQAEPITSLATSLSNFSQAVHDWLGEVNRDEEQQPLVEFVLPVYFATNQYLRIAEYYDDSFETKLSHDTTTVVKQLCLDPSHFIDLSLAKGRGAVLFSATLSPIDYYQDILGGSDNSLAYQLSSPFAQTHQAVIATANIQTTYQQREANLPELIATLTALVMSKAGNYLFFFPSYQYLDQVYTAFARANPTADLCRQVPSMNAEDRDAFLANFTTDSHQVGFAVLGGIFSEGIDLKGDRLIGVAVISVGLPGLNSETDRLKEYFNKKNGQGFAYAYQLPGFNNVLQAAGRVIRGAHDYGVVLLIDARFTTPRYRRLFPKHWQHATTSRNLTQLSEQLVNFWANVDQSD
ncbi:ATP-dependent DNA helicase [Lacticaseibacillus saniviri]|uniref:Superfamily II DNA and RNA helicase n=1 Tax=Lacticaseibacillus saniviri JCM 17471 = DSM 24301 TaxID=1293598 RepID=A0A0R2MYV1_9LACO|nr:ATP-dependent DNA helicase [Lacticaseibacillus saniviri]KRO18862.1 superfamily II DNA and RNA helicase [Lacticaseibacillus saniviri JCM 17471 = DSM 24301]MCG4281439.1 ATP-dependent DNA helicase [Lacticaseibacillus saniviri]